MIKACYYEDVITVEDGALFRTVIAHWAATRRHDGGCYAVYMIDENGKEYCRALMCSMYCGYFIDEDREKTEDMKPTAEAQTVLEKWLKDFGKDAVKAMKKVA